MDDIPQNEKKGLVITSYIMKEFFGVNLDMYRIECDQRSNGKLKDNTVI